MSLRDNQRRDSQKTMAKRTSDVYQSQKKRAKGLFQVLEYSLEEFRLWLADKWGMCSYCGRILSCEEWSVDHMMPVSRNGDHKLRNLTIACKPCNESKGNMSGDEFMDLLNLMQNWNLAARSSLLARLRTGGKYRYQ
jgi:5-methylcytosine-specific restriction endonuclease McrA